MKSITNDVCRHSFLRPLFFSRPSWRAVLPAVFAFVVLAGQSVAEVGLPVGVQMMVDVAEENYFDGDFPNAIRCIGDAEKWLNSPANKRDLARMEIDHSVTKAMLAGLRAEILFAQGEEGKARSALQLAEQTLKNRRQHYAIRGMFPEMLWHYEAFLLFVRGDLARPAPDFGLADDPRIPEEVKRRVANLGKARDSIGAYRNAEQVLGRPMARQNPNSRTACRLEGRLFTNLARLELLRPGGATPQDAIDAENSLERAEAAFARDEFWGKCIKQDQFGELPKTMKDVSDSEKDPTKRLQLKRMFSQTIQDWVAIQLTRVELSAYQEQADADAVTALVQSTEQHYDRIVGFLKAQYSASHPRVQEVRNSRARWLLALAKRPEAALATRFSWLQDSLQELEAVKSLSVREMVQRDVVELVARSRMIELNDELKVLDDVAVASQIDRMNDLSQRLKEQKSGDNQVVQDNAEIPFQVREPEMFWSGKTVFQKRGIVIEDEDFIIRERYWTLDQSVTGKVIDVELADGKDTFVTVGFDGMGGGWRAESVNIRDRVVSKTERTLTIRPDHYGDGTKVEVDEVTVTHRIEGDQVEPNRCGVLVRHEGAAIAVRFPGNLLSVVSPRKGDAVVRSWDWHDGFADGGLEPKGRGSEASRECVGRVVRDRDADGFLEIEWEKTKRKKLHRFDHAGYYDVEPLP
jgi:hypothetical protein